MLAWGVFWDWGVGCGGRGKEWVWEGRTYRSTSSPLSFSMIAVGLRVLGEEFCECECFGRGTFVGGKDLVGGLA